MFTIWVLRQMKKQNSRLVNFVMESRLASAHISSSSEREGQIVGTRESLNGPKNLARRKVKNGEKSPWGQCLTRLVSNNHLLKLCTCIFSKLNNNPIFLKF